MQQVPSPAVNEFDDLKSGQVETKMYEEALKSTDPEVIKKARTAVKSRITSAVNSINALVKDTDGKFDHSKKSKTNALSTPEKLVANLELVKNLHESFRIHRERGKDQTSEETLLEKDEEYVTELELKAHKAIDVFIKYEESFAAREKAKADQVDILWKRLFLSSMKEDYFSNKKAIQ